eukprot:scaffold15093_cov114-Isochrysis_galbana.AAC.6
MGVGMGWGGGLVVGARAHTVASVSPHTVHPTRPLATRGRIAEPPPAHKTSTPLASTSPRALQLSLAQLNDSPHATGDFTRSLKLSLFAPTPALTAPAAGHSYSHSPAARH